MKDEMVVAPGETGRWVRALTLGALALIAILTALTLAACGGDDDGDVEDEASVAELSSGLPTADDLGLDEVQELDWDSATDLLAVDLVIGGDSDAGELGEAIEDAGFQSAAGSDLEGKDLNVRIRAIQFDSEDGALEARDLLHAEDLKSPCPDACIVTPMEYELDNVPESTAVHHVPVRSDLPPGQRRVEAHHAEFVIGSLLYVVQMDGQPSPTFSADFDELMGTVYESASGAE